VGDDSNKADDFERLDSIEESDSGFTDYLDSVSSVSFRHTRGETDKKLEALQNTAAPPTNSSNRPVRLLSIISTTRAILPSE